jgi:2-oxoisovalerate dehydrogenase E1 component alpha subunit
LFTYRAEGHSTSDDPSRYRPTDEWSAWPLGDPIERLKRHLICLGAWSDKEHEALVQEATTLVRETQREAESIGTLADGSRAPTQTVFEDVFKDMPWHLHQQMKRAGI